MTELLNIIPELDNMMVQLGTFIGQFESLIQAHNVHVITSAGGLTEMDFPSSMSDDTLTRVNYKIGIIKDLVGHHKQSLTDLFKQASILEDQIKTSDPNYTSQLASRLSRFAELKNAFKH